MHIFLWEKLELEASITVVQQMNLILKKLRYNSQPPPPSFPPLKNHPDTPFLYLKKSNIHSVVCFT